MSQSENPRAHSDLSETHRNLSDSPSEPTFDTPPAGPLSYGRLFFGRATRQMLLRPFIFSTLTRSTRVLTPEMAGEESAVVLHALEKQGLLASVRTQAALIEFCGPLHRQHPGDPDPDLAKLSWMLHRRWRDTPSRTVKLYFATDRAKRLHGGQGGRLRRPFQLQHDLLVAAVFFHLLRKDPQVVRNWIPDFLLSTIDYPGRKRPDAVILNDDGEPSLVIEVGGLYSRKRLEKFHDDCNRCGLPYEIW
jgi:hypothetical protein